MQYETGQISHPSSLGCEKGVGKEGSVVPLSRHMILVLQSLIIMGGGGRIRQKFGGSRFPPSRGDNQQWTQEEIQ